jgi:hypothetical protein
VQRGSTTGADRTPWTLEYGVWSMEYGVWSMELRGSDKGEMRDTAATLDEQGWPAYWSAGANGRGLWINAEISPPPLRTIRSVRGDEHLERRRLQRGAEESSAHCDVREAPHHGTGRQLTRERRRRWSGIRDAPHCDDRDLDAASLTLPSGDRILGVLGVRMVALTGQRTVGIHPFLLTPESNSTHSQILGPHALIAPHQAVVLETDPAKARAIARRGIGMFIGFPGRQANLHRLGFGDDDLDPGESDGLIDATVAWGEGSRARVAPEASSDRACHPSRSFKVARIAF